MKKRTNQKNQRKRRNPVNVEALDTRVSKGADTLNNTSGNSNEDNVNEERFDTHNSEGADTLSTIVNKSLKEVNKSKKKNKTEWVKPKRMPSKIEERKLFGKGLEMMLNLCMKNHVYQFENRTRIQNKGGPIGLKLTGEIADCLMVDWDLKFLEKLKSIGVIPEIYTRFKDDIQIATECLEKGSKLVDEKLHIDEIKKSSDENVSDSKLTMEIIHQIANQINPMIRLTVETPCNFEDGKMPVFDIKVKVNCDEMNIIDF